MAPLAPNEQLFAFQPKLYRKAVNVHSLLWTPGMKRRKKQEKPSLNWWLWVWKKRWGRNMSLTCPQICDWETYEWNTFICPPFLS